MINLIVADDTGVSGANTFIDKEYVDAYAESMGNDVWCNNSNKQDVALIQSAQFLSLRYTPNLSGTVLNSSQILAFPRVVNGVSTGVPEQVKMAQAVLAIQFLELGVLALDANADAGRVVQSESVSLGGGAISESKTYATVSANKQISKNVYSTADAFMRQLPYYGSKSVFIPTYRG